MIAAIALLAVACNKDQKAVKRLDGTWEQTSFKIFYGGASFEFVGQEGFPSTTYRFTKCKLKDEEFCEGSITNSLDGESVTENILYRVTGDGTKLEYKDDTSSDTITALTIEELTKEEATIEIEDEFPLGEDGEMVAVTVVVKLEKK